MRQGLVLDASVVTNWILVDEQPATFASVFDRMNEYVLYAPALLYPESTNAVLQAVKRQRLSEENAHVALRFLEKLPIQVFAADWTLEELFSTGQRFGLTAYDSCYLLAAIRLAVPLLSLDRRLESAASDAGLPSLTSR